jgi:hypothetical protein
MPTQVKVAEVPPVTEPAASAHPRTLVDVASEALDTVVDRGAIPIYRRLTGDVDTELAPPTSEERERMRLAVLALGVGWLMGWVFAPRRTKRISVPVEKHSSKQPELAHESSAGVGGILGALMPLLITLLKALLERRPQPTEPRKK